MGVARHRYSSPVDQHDEQRSPAVSHAPGWHPDPFGRHEFRYFDGARWTGDVASGGVRSFDPPVWTTDPGRAGAAPPTSGDRSAVVALVLGIVAVCLAWLPFLVVGGAASAVGALVAARRARRRAASRRAAHATAGRVLGWIALVLVVPGILLTRTALGMFSPGPHTVEIASCTSTAGRAVLQGSITNLSDDERGYLILVRFSRDGTGSVLADKVVQVDDVVAGGSTDFVTAISTDVSSVRCSVVDVLGGLPIDVT